MTIKPPHTQIISFTDAWVQDKANLKVVEIGVWRGANANFCLNRWGHAIKEWHLIDPYNYETYHPVFLNDRSQDKAQAQAAVEFAKDKCVWVEDYSQNVIDTYDDDSIDFLYVDGNHSYEAVALDIALYYPKVKEGGLIIFDDYNEPEVNRAVLEFTTRINRFAHETRSHPSHAYLVK